MVPRSEIKGSVRSTQYNLSYSPARLRIPNWKSDGSKHCFGCESLYTDELLPIKISICFHRNSVPIINCCHTGCSDQGTSRWSDEILLIFTYNYPVWNLQSCKRKSTSAAVTSSRLSCKCWNSDVAGCHGQKESYPAFLFRTRSSPRLQQGLTRVTHRLDQLRRVINYNSHMMSAVFSRNQHEERKLSS
jgi:hypothetical protein